MKQVIQHSRCRAQAFLVALVIGLACDGASAAVTILGTQYQPDQYFPEFDCYWNASAYPGPCRTPIRGATLHVYVKNTGATAVTNNDVNLTTSSATYSLNRVIKTSTASYNPDGQSSIYFYWDNPPSDVMAAGEPVWYRFDPPTIGAGKVGQVAVRMRYVPTTPTVTLGVVTSAGTVITNVVVDANTPRVASIGYSDDLRKVYLHWRRSGGAAPTSVWLDGTDVTASTATVGDPTVNFGASVVSLASPLSFFSYHVFQGAYGDGKIASASQRAWTNKFIYATYSAFDNYTGADWVAEASDHGFNNVQMNLGIMGNYLGTASGRADCLAHGYGYTILDKSKLNALDPDMWFLNDEPDAEENNQSNTHCGTAYKIPCDSSHWVGTLVKKTLAYGETELRKARPNVPFTVNLDGGLEPESFFTWGPAVDILQTDNYYEVRLKDSYLSYPNRIPLFNNARFSYAVARTACAGAEPNPSNHLLYSNKDNDTGWPYPAPQSKRFEAYYSLAGGSKGMGYWWFNPPEGLNSSSQCAPLWKEMGLVGNEIKTARPLLVISTPVDLTLTPSTTDVWARPLASGNNTLLLLVVNNKYTNDITGCHYTAVPNATVTATLPSWMLASPTAFEITAGGLWDVSTVLNGSQLQVNLGTLSLTKMIVVTTDPTLRSTIQTRYDTQVKPHVCNFAQELCASTAPTIAQQPANQTVAPGGTGHFTVVTGGTSPLSYRWQKNNVNLSNGGHYSGCTTITLTISSADADNDAAAYRCVVTNNYGSVTSSSATLTVTNMDYPPAITQEPTDDSVVAGGTVIFTVLANGSEPLGYLWQKNNVNLSDGGHYWGSTTAALTITNADNTDEASYRCVITNAYGSTNSAAATLTINWCIPSVLLGHGDMEDTSSYSVCPDWESYSAGNGVASWAKESTTIHGGSAAQKCRNSNGGANSVLGVRQTFDANVGDAFTFEGWVNPVSNPGAGQQVAMVVGWDGSTSNPTTNGGSWKISTGLRDVWTHLSNLSGNATDTEVTLFLDSRRTASSQDLTAYWDDVVAYRAYVPVAPLVSGASSTSLNVKVTPDCNSANSAAQFAISIGGGAYTMGTHWVQANGTVGTAMVWQSAAAWGTRTVTGLATGTPYTFAAQTRYSSTLTQPTSLGAGAMGTPIGSQPPAITQQPSAQSVCPNDTAAFSVAASGEGTITYQWQKNSVNLSNGGHYSGATSTTLTVSTVDANDVASYRCVVSSNPGGSTNSSEAELTLKAATIITGSPLRQTVRPGANATFSVTATGEGTLTYQWQTNAPNINDGSHYGGCTTASLTVSNVGSADAVSYRCMVTAGCGAAISSEAYLTLATNALGSVTLSTIPTLPGDMVNDARAITPDGRWVVGVSGSRGFLHAVNTTNLFNAVSSDGAQATLLTGVGYRTNSGQPQVVMSGLAGGLYTAWMTADGGATWDAKVQGVSGKNPTVPMANGLAGSASDVFCSVWTDEGSGASDNWGLNVGRFSNSWPATVAWGPKSVAKPDTTQMNGVSSDGRAVGWRRNGTTLVYANYVADWQGVATPAIWNFNGLDGTTAGQALSVSADGTAIFGISPKSVATGSTNYGYKAVFGATMPGPATQLSISQLPNFPDTAGSSNLAVPYGCTPDGKYAVGMNCRGIEKAVLWDTSHPNPGEWSVVDLTEVAAANSILNGFARLSRAYSVGTDAAGALVIAGVGLDTSNPANARAFLMTVSPPIAPIAFPPIVTTFGLSPDGFTCSFMSLANPDITYYLDCTTNLAPPSTWTPISSTPGIGGMTSLSDASPPGQQRFYRIRIQ